MNRVRELRMRNDYTLKLVAAECGVDISSVHKWEQGDVAPVAKHLMKLADLYGVSVDYILGRNTSETEQAYELILRAEEIARRK